MGDAMTDKLTDLEREAVRVLMRFCKVRAANMGRTDPRRDMLFKAVSILEKSEAING
jgi:hypothetical protein